MSPSLSPAPHNVRTNSHKRILVFCPEAEPRNEITAFLKQRGFHHLYIQNSERNLSSWIDHCAIDVVVLFNPERFWITIDLAQWLREQHPDCDAVILPGPNYQLLAPHWKKTLLKTIYSQTTGGVQ